MEEEQGSYQSEESQVEETPIESVESAPPQEEYDEITYNKETVKIPVSERKNYLQKGMNYEKVQAKATELEGQVKYLEKRARQEGFGDVQSYLKAIDEYEQHQQIEQESQRMGVDPETYAQYFQPVNQQLTELQQKVQTYEQEIQQRSQLEHTNQVWGELYKEYPSLLDSAKAFTEGKNPDWYNNGMQDLINKGYSPVHAYELAHKQTLFQQKEQEVLARVTGRDSKQILPSKDSPNNMQFDPANMTYEEIKAISRRAQSGERITF